MGSLRGEVLSFVEERQLLVASESATHGYMSRDGRERGRAYIEVSLGHYWLPLRTDVVAYLGFDSIGRLSAVDVRKYVDAP